MLRGEHVLSPSIARSIAHSSIQHLRHHLQKKIVTMLATRSSLRLSTARGVRAAPVSRSRCTKAMAYKVTLKTPSGECRLPIGGGVGQGG